MPLRNKPKSLCEYSMLTIARHFDYLCYKCNSRKEMRKMMDDETFLNVDGPFRLMPPSLCVGLQDALCSIYGYLRRYHLHALVHRNQEEFFIHNVGDKMYCVDLIGSRCVRLRHLDLSYLCHISPGQIIRLVPTLKHIIVLNLKMTEISDHVLSLIGKHCSEIRILDISSCPVMSNGIRSLCFDMENQRHLCPKLLSLSISGCSVTAESLYFLLHRIPTLRQLQYENTLEIFNVKKSDSEFDVFTESDQKVFHLSHLTSTDNIVSEWSLDRATNLCPLVTHVTISNTIIQNETLYRLMNLQHLTHLNLTNNDSLSLDFYEGVLPVLTLCGFRLQSLLLTKFTNVDINAIGEVCPQLRNLALSSIAYYEAVINPKENLFTKLTALELWSNIHDESVESVLLKQLLFFCPKLQNLLVSGTRTLSDKLLMEIWKRNKMEKLSRVTLENCPEISRHTIENILNSRNQIVLMRVWSCFLISKGDNEFIQSLIREENFDVYFEWYPWFG